MPILGHTSGFSAKSARRGGTLYVQASPKMPQFKNMTLFVAKC